MFRTQVSVAKFPKGGYHLVAMILPGSDEMWVRRSHPAVFRDAERAERFKERIQYKPLNLANWIGEDWVASPLRVDEAANPAFYSVL